MIDKELARNYSNIVKLMRILKPHASNALLFENGFTLLQPLMNGVRSYMFTNPGIVSPQFLFTYFNVPEIAKVNTKYKKTMSDIDWVVEDGTRFLQITNKDSEPYIIPVLNDGKTRSDLLKNVYRNIKDPEEFNREPDIMFIELGEDFISKMTSNQLCSLNIDDTEILLSKPFLGDLKKTEFVGYRILSRETIHTGDEIISMKFKQVESLGEIYTYATFLVI